MRFRLYSKMRNMTVQQIFEEHQKGRLRGYAVAQRVKEKKLRHDSNLALTGSINELAVQLQGGDQRQTPTENGKEGDMGLRFYLTAKGEDLACTSLAPGYALLRGMKCYRTSCGLGCRPSTYFYPEPAELRQRIADLKDPLTPAVVELRERIAVLEGPPAPTVAEGGACASWQGLLAEMEDFVDCYEKAFAERAEWMPVYRRYEEDVIDDYIEEDAYIALPLNAGDPPGSEGGGSLAGQVVEWGEPTLMEYEKIPGEMHREPYIILC